MRLDVQVCGRTAAQLYREGDEYVLKYLPDTAPADFVSLAMPVREQAPKLALTEIQESADTRRTQSCTSTDYRVR